jgi:glycosyltransferase involved in cell wall biosynthesis
MQHIALVTTSYPDDTPGSEAAGSFVEDFALELASRTRVTVVAAGRNSNVSVNGNLTVRRFAVPRLPLSLLNPKRPADWLPIVSTLRHGLKALESLVNSDRPDHIFALWALPSGYWARRISKQYQIGYSIWALGSDIWSLGKVPVVRSELARVLRNASICYADGYQLGKAVEQLSSKDCRFLPSTRRMVSMRSSPLSDAPPYKLAYLGRWHHNKGVDLLFDALSQLSDKDWQRISEVRIFGGGPLAEVVNEKAANLRQQGKTITIGGYLDKKQASELIGWADYLLLPSRIESIPVIFSDAAKMGTPVISTPVGDLPRLHELYQFGVLASEANPGAFSRAVSSAIGRHPADFAPGLARAAADFDLPGIATRFMAETGCCTSIDHTSQRVCS